MYLSWMVFREPSQRKAVGLREMPWISFYIERRRCGATLPDEQRTASYQQYVPMSEFQKVQGWIDY